MVVCWCPFLVFGETGHSPPVSEMSPAFVVSAPSLFVGVQADIMANRFSGKITGLRVKDVAKDSIAYAAGLRASDMIVSWNGVSLVGHNPAFVNTLKAESKDGVIRVLLEIRRKREKNTLPIELALMEIEGRVDLKLRKE